MEATCQDIAVWRTYCDGSMSANERAVAESHLASCRRCRELTISIFDTANEGKHEAAPDFVKARALRLAPQRTTRTLYTSFRPFVPVALAAGIVLAVGVSFWIYRDKSAVSLTGDLRQSANATSQLSLTNPPNGATLDAGMIEFRWNDSLTGARYEFTLTDEAGDIVFQKQDAASPLSLDTANPKLLPRRRYYWSVTAKLLDGTRRESPIAAFTIK